MNDDKKTSDTLSNQQTIPDRDPDGVGEAVAGNIRPELATGQEEKNPAPVEEFGKEDKPRFSVEEIYGVAPQKTEPASGNVFSQEPQKVPQNLPTEVLENEKLDNIQNQEKVAPTNVLNEGVGSALPQSPLNTLEPESPRPQENTSHDVSQNQSLDPEKNLENLSPKRKFPKIIVLFAVLLLVLSGLIYFFIKFKGLGGGQLFGKKGEIVWWGMRLEEVDINPLIKEYEEKNPGVKISYVKQPPNDYRERLTNSLAAGNGPDIFEIHNSWPPMFANELSALPAQVMSTDEFSKIFYPVIVSDLTTSKGIVGMPLEYDALTLFINEDIFTSSARTPPKTWDELRTLAADFTQVREDGAIIQAGIPMGFTQNIDHWSDVLALMMIQNGASLANPVGERARSSIDYYLLFKGDGVWDQTLPASTVAFARGKVAMYFGPTRRAFDIAKENPNLKFRTVFLPQLAKEKPTDPDFSYATYWLEGVWDRSRNKEMSWDFLKFMSSSESIEKLNHNLKQRTNLERISPRIEMAQMWKDDPILGSVTALATNAKSWYLENDTNDGETGINTQLNNIYQGVVEPPIGGDAKSLESIATEIAGILAKYKIPIK